MARLSCLPATLVGLTTLLVGVVARSGSGVKPSSVPDGAAHATMVAQSGQVSLVLTPGPTPPAALSASPHSEDPVERARRGVVTVERNGEAIGLGGVLKNDGRILTALSALGDGNSLDVRYADGSIAHCRVGHSDRVWDLALLIPQVGRWPEGLSASEGDPLRSGAQLRAFVPGKGHVQPATVVFKNKRSLLGADNQVVRDVFEVATKLGPNEFGSPVVDETGNVVAILGHACTPVEKGPCAPTAFGVPVDALRAFLRTTPVSAVPPAAWLGIQGVPDRTGSVQGVRVVSISPESPADEAGLHAHANRAHSDLVVAVDDQPVSTPEGLSAKIREKAVGDRIKLLVFGSGRFRDATAVLKPAPQQSR